MSLDQAEPSPIDDEPDFLQSEPLFVHQPQNKFLRRLPVMLYRLGFGPLLGVMPLLILTTRGRGGTMRYTPLEYRRHGNNVYVLATDRSARWLKRVYEDAVVTVTIGVGAYPAVAEVVTDDAEGVRALFQFRMNAPAPLRWIYWSGRNRDIVRADRFKHAARRYTFVRLEPLSTRTMAVPAVPADRAWMTILVLALVGVLALASRRGRA